VFDHLEWWQVILLLAPVVVVMTSVKYFERRRGSTLYHELTPTQKTFVLLQLLPPSLAADFLRRLDVNELETYLQAGARIKGTGLLVHEQVMKEYFKDLKCKGDTEGSLQERLATAALTDDEAALAHIQRVWPRPESV
jgi:hypothetical protein